MQSEMFAQMNKMGRYIVQTTDLQAKTYSTICTHHKLRHNIENKIPVWP